MIKLKTTSKTKLESIWVNLTNLRSGIGDQDNPKKIKQKKLESTQINSTNLSLEI
jgi:hypothetical protein